MRSNTPQCIITKKGNVTIKTQYFLNGKEVALHLFKQKIKRLDPPEIIINNE